MRSGIFGWSYPPGAANDPNAPWNQVDPPCDVCGQPCDDCICPECPECKELGNPNCYEEHGLTRTPAQIAGRKKLDEREAALEAQLSGLAPDWDDPERKAEDAGMEQYWDDPERHERGKT